MVNSTLSFCKTYARSLILFLLEEIYIYMIENTKATISALHTGRKKRKGGKETDR